MKKLIYAILGVAVIGSCIAMYASRPTNPAAASAQAQAASAAQPASENIPLVQAAVATPAAPAPDTGDSRPAVIAAATETSAKAIDPAISRAFDSLFSRQLTHEQRRDILKKLVESGKIDQAIGELQQQVADNPRNAEYQTALGQAYIEKAVALQDDIPDKAILAMQAMKSFDAALSVDSANWEARYTRTSVMSHYPAEMNKGQEVIDQFTQLINQQEAQTPQPQFAKTYVALGDQYQKLGQNDYALATWQAGAQLFPSDKTLQKRLTQPAGQ